MIEGRDFLRAYEFLDGMADEVGARTQTGRAYHAAFLEARSVCEIHLAYERTKTSREHAEIARLRKAFDPRMGDDLAILRRLRNLADYDLTVSNATVLLQAARADDYALSIISRLDRIVIANQEADQDDYIESDSPDDL
jgi:hypothetical protein